MIIKWNDNFTDIAGYSKEVFNMFVDAVNERCKVIGIPDIAYPYKTRFTITKLPIVDENGTQTFPNLDKTIFIFSLNNNIKSIRGDRLFKDLQENFPEATWSGNIICETNFTATMNILGHGLLVTKEQIRTEFEPYDINLIEYNYVSPGTSYVYIYNGNNVDQTTGKYHAFRQATLGINNYVQYGEECITLEHGWQKLQLFVYEISKYFCKHINKDGSVFAEKFFEDKDIVNSWLVPTRNSWYENDKDHFDRIYGISNSRYTRYGPTDYFVPNIFHRKYPREINHFNEHGEEGWIARFVFNPTSQDNSQYVDGFKIYDTLFLSSVVNHQSENNELLQYSGLLFEYKNGKWTYLPYDDSRKPQPDILNSTGLIQHGDYFGPWILNDLRDTINLLIWTFGSGNINTPFISSNDEREEFVGHDDPNHGSNFISPYSFTVGVEALYTGIHSGTVEQEYAASPTGVLGPFPEPTGSKLIQYFLSPGGTQKINSIWLFARDIPFNVDIDIYNESLYYNNTPFNLDAEYGEFSKYYINNPASFLESYNGIIYFKFSGAVNDDYFGEEIIETWVKGTPDKLVFRKIIKSNGVGPETITHVDQDVIIDYFLPRLNALFPEFRYKYINTIHYDNPLTHKQFSRVTLDTDNILIFRWDITGGFKYTERSSIYTEIADET